MREISVAAAILLIMLGTQARAASLCSDKNVNKVHDAARDSLFQVLARPDAHSSKIGVGSCAQHQGGGVVTFDHKKETLYLVQGFCISGSERTSVHAVMQCNPAKNDFTMLGLSWDGPEGHGVAGGPFVK